jgi:hypothetical protein
MACLKEGGIEALAEGGRPGMLPVTLRLEDERLLR